MDQVLGFLFIVAVPLVVVAGGLVTLFAVGALFDFLENQEAFAKRIEAAFRRPPRLRPPSGPTTTTGPTGCVSPRGAGRPARGGGAHRASTPRSRPTFEKAAAARSMCSGRWAAESWTRMRDWPFGTTGKKNPFT